MSLPGGVLNDPRWQAFDADGTPLALCKLYSYETGGSFSTPQYLYTDSDLTTPHTNPVVADADGRFAEMFLLPLGYDLRLKDANGNTIWDAENVEDIGQAFLSDLGSYLAEGREVTNGDTVLPTDLLVKFNASSGSGILNLEPVVDRTEQLIVMNIGTVDCLVTPNGTDDINFVNAAFTVPAGTTPNWPVAIFLPRQADVSYVLVGGAYLV